MHDLQIKSIVDRPIEQPAGGYQGSKKCQACHPKQYHTWHASYHRTMTQIASEESIAGDFNNVSFELEGKHYKAYKEKEEYYVEIPIETNNTSSPPIHTSLKTKVVLTTGSHHYQVYWFSADGGRTLAQFPFVYVIKDQRWIPRKSAFLAPPTTEVSIEYARWNTTCIKCHTTFGRPMPYESDGIQKLDSQAAEFGISCEACHGPADQHISANKNPLRRYLLHLTSKSDENIVNPKKLPAKLSAQVCGQCHGITILKTDEDDIRWTTEGFKFRPGDELTKTRHIITFNKSDSALPFQRYLSSEKGGSFWPDGMIRLAGREYTGLIASPCYKSGEFSCLNCHAPHQENEDTRPLNEWANDLLKPIAYSNTPCVTCHEGFKTKENLTRHTNHQVESSGSQCQNCHMPYTSYGLHKAIRSHTIDSPKIETSISTGRPSACNLCHLDKTLQWSATQLNQWYGQNIPEMTVEQKKTAASLLWLLKGDATQRALLAWAMGWKPAQEASGTEWLAPYLAISLTDPYDANRNIAYRSLQTLPAYSELSYDFVGTDGHRKEVRAHVYASWKNARQGKSRIENPELLLNANGDINWADVKALIDQRDNTEVWLNE